MRSRRSSTSSTLSGEGSAPLSWARSAAVRAVALKASKCSLTFWSFRRVEGALLPVMDLLLRVERGPLLVQLHPFLQLPEDLRHRQMGAHTLSS